MGKTTGISWTDHTWNTWIGCRKVSPACAYCYAGEWARRYAKPFYPPTDLGRVATDADSPVWRTKTWRDPLKWDRQAREAGVQRRVFTCSLSDFFLDHPQVHEWRQEAWEIMRDTPHLLWLVLSKRWDLGWQYITDCLPGDWGEGYENVMLGVTVENPAAAPRLREACLVPCERGLFVSCEPLLDRLDLSNIRLDSTRRLDALRGLFYHAGEQSQSISRVRWIIGGGESGSKARPTHPDWARALRDDARCAGVPFHWKQNGQFGPGCLRMDTGDAVYSAFHSYGEWIAKASSRIGKGDICLDTRGKRLEIGQDWAGARDEGTFPVTIMRRMSIERAGRLIEGALHDAGPEDRQCARY